MQLDRAVLHAHMIYILPIIGCCTPTSPCSHLDEKRLYRIWGGEICALVKWSNGPGEFVKDESTPSYSWIITDRMFEHWTSTLDLSPFSRHFICPHKCFRVSSDLADASENRMPENKNFQIAVRLLLGGRFHSCAHAVWCSWSAATLWIHLMWPWHGPIAEFVAEGRSNVRWVPWNHVKVADFPYWAPVFNCIRLLLLCIKTNF